MPIETIQTAHGKFVRPPQVVALAEKRFTLKELAEAFACDEGALIAAVTRFGMFLISEPGHGRTPRQFHLLDAYALLVFLSFYKQFGPAARKTLVSQVSHLLFGDPMSQAEVTERRGEMAKEYDALKTPSARAKFGGRMFRVLQQRRAEIKRDMFEAHPMWWSRDADRRFVLFGCENHTIITGLFDRNVDGGKISFEKLAEIRAGSWVNVTEWFCFADRQLAGVVEQRKVEAD
jgi:hypothetical protein